MGDLGALCISLAFVAFGTFDPETKAVTFQVYINPLVVWLWIGGIVLVVGAGISTYPSKAESEPVTVRRRAAAQAVTT